MNISIITISKLIDESYLKILFKNIKEQTYKNIIEWIIIEEKEELHNTIFLDIIIQELIDTNPSFSIKFIKNINHITNLFDINVVELGYASGDIIFWMDTKNYYNNTSIQYMVNKLIESNKLSLYNDTMYIHDIIINKTIKIIVPKIIPVNYMINNIYNYIYKKECINIIYDECAFTSDHIMVKIINSSGYMRNDVIINSFKENIINTTIPEEYYNLYKELHSIKEYFPADIVYFTGGHCIEWEPSDKSLGGSEQAIVNLSENWVKMGKSVAVYTKLKDSKEHTLNGVNYLNWFSFPFEKKIKKLIVWRHTGIMMLMNMNFEKPDELIVDFHDNFSYTLSHLNQKLLLEFMNKVNWFHVKSNYHKQCLEEYLGQNLNNIRVIMNGIRVSNFANNNNYVRNPYRLCYCSSYDRGLETILEKLWPYIYKKEPRAELHVYYGMIHMTEPLKSKLKMLLSQEGVMDHGRQPLDMIVREKYISSFHLYLNNNVAEIDCISIRESLVTGCIPIISKFGVFKERHGLMIDFSDNMDNNMYEMIATDIVSKMNDIKFMEDARNQLMVSSTIIDWYDVAKMWLL